nr:hypothetical protein [uncultured Ruminococcus sp.]
MGDCLKNLFVQQFDSFMAEHGYTQNINCFSKLYNDIFARVYLFYHYDKNYDELQFDVIHSFTPLIFEIDTKCICDGDDDFSLSRLSGEEYIADATDKSDVTNCISRMFSKYSELYESFFSAKSVSEYLDKYLMYDKLICSGKEKIEETNDFLGLDSIYIYLYLKEYNSAENEIEKYLQMLNDLKTSVPVDYCKIREYETDISYFENLKNAIISNDVNALKPEIDKMNDNIKINQTKLKTY